MKTRRALTAAMVAIVAIAVGLTLMLMPTAERGVEAQTRRVSSTLFLAEPGGNGPNNDAPFYDASVFCESDRPFSVYIWASTGSTPASGLVRFSPVGGGPVDLDNVVGFLIDDTGPGRVFSTTQAVESGRVEIFPIDTDEVGTFGISPLDPHPNDNVSDGPATGILYGWMSAQSLDGSLVTCGTTD